MSYFERVHRLIEVFNRLGIPQYQGEYFLKSRDLDTLEIMFNLTQLD